MPRFRPLSEEEASTLIKYLRVKVLERLGVESNVQVDPTQLINIASKRYGVFVSIERITYSDGMVKRVLRGSMGTIRPIKNLLEDSITATIHAAFYDPRYSPITPAEFKNCVLEVTLISQLFRVDEDWLRSKHVIGYHGFYVPGQGKFTIILPQRVIEWVEDYHSKVGRPINREDFMKILCDYANVCEFNNINAFETQILYELRPEEEVVERKLYLNRLISNDLKLIENL
ncbi:AMMECR1 domain-containing protein [Vulcanisaeta thermophila]|uniref:AMMECR1 domain-containing protein n=1 Tax=Vulcanisaeta thermophila TaxID=867917 RepID=UPI000853E0AB|nr:AMMECR1 domain-containing protein [Vulcanisaeta thermophila]